VYIILKGFMGERNK